MRPELLYTQRRWRRLWLALAWLGASLLGVGIGLLVGWLVLQP